MKFRTRSLSIILSMAMVFNMCPAIVQASAASELASTGNSTGISLGLSKGDAIGDTSYSVRALNSYYVAPDVMEYTVTTNVSDGTSQNVANVMELSNAYGNATAAVSYGDIEEPIDYTLCSLTDQCALWETVTGEDVIGGVNGSWHSMSTGKPTGMTVIRGMTVDSSTTYPYFATYSDGSYSIEQKGTKIATAEANQSEKQGTEVTMTGACAGPSIMVEGGEVTNDFGDYNTSLYPRTAIGIKEDGTLVYFQDDGLQSPRSVGFYMQEEAEMLKALGCEIALQLDEGGSSCFVSKRDGESSVSVRNTPTDGAQRAVAVCVLAVSTPTGTGGYDQPDSTNDDHDFVWDQKTDQLTCTKCSYETTMAEEQWSGFLRDKETDRVMYTTAGVKSTGLVSIADGNGDAVAYYFDADGLAYPDGTYTICGESCTLQDAAIISWENENILSIGFAGDDIGYVVYQDGSMYMEGTGVMWNFTSAGNTPWGAIHEHGITTVTIGDGITSIGVDAFQMCYELVSVTTTDSITRIRGNSFYGCSSLESVYISENVTAITDNAFNNTPDTLVLSVGYDSYAKQFAEEHGLNYVEREPVPVKKNDTYTVDEIQYLVTSASKKTVSVKNPAKSTITSIKVPATVKIHGVSYQVTAIESNAFSTCSKLKTVSGGANVTTIKSNAFNGCVKLTTVTGFAQVTKIASQAFQNCVKLKQIGGKTDVVTLKSVKTIGPRAFYGCKAILKVRTPSTGLESIKQAAFRGCTKMNTFRSVSKKVNLIGKYAFYGDKNLSTITLKTTKLTKNKVKDKAFKGIKSTCKFRVPASKAASYKKIFLEKGAGSGCKVVKLNS